MMTGCTSLSITPLSKQWCSDYDLRHLLLLTLRITIKSAWCHAEVVTQCVHVVASGIVIHFDVVHDVTCVDVYTDCDGAIINHDCVCCIVA